MAPRGARRVPVIAERVLGRSFSANGPILLSLDGAEIAIPWRAFGHFTGPLALPGSNRRLGPTDKRFDITGCDFYTFRDGKVATMKASTTPSMSSSN